MALRATLARQAFYTPVLDFAANTYAGMLGKQLKKYGASSNSPHDANRPRNSFQPPFLSTGLQFEDIYCETPEVMEAVKRISPAEQEARSMRIRR